MMKKMVRRKDKHGGKAKPKDDHAQAAKNEDLQHAATSPTAVGRRSEEMTETNEYSKYGIANSPAKQYTRGEKTQSVELGKAEKAIRKDGFGKYLKASRKSDGASAPVYGDEVTALAYLYGRGFFRKEKGKERIRKVKKLLQSKKAIAILLKLVKNDGDRDGTATYGQLYINAKVALDRYLEQPGAFSFLCGHSPGKKLELYCRTQAHHGNCFIHGPCMTNSYLLQRHDCNLDTDGLDVGAVDVQKYICRTFSDQELYDYLLTDDGGESVSTFETILKGTLGKTPRFANGTPEVMVKAEKSLRELLSKYGPGLVCRFSVGGNFLQGGNRNSQNEIGYIQFTGKDIERAEGVFVRLDGEKSDEHNVEVELQEYLRQHLSKDPRKKLFASTECDESSHDGPGNLGTDTTASTYNNKDAGKKKKVMGKHAMALIGGRHDESEKRDYFLLQNWWSDMQLVEVDLDYLEESGANLYFVKPEHFGDLHTLNLDECYSMNRYRVTDAYNLDRADTEHGCFNRTPRERMV